MTQKWQSEPTDGLKDGWVFLPFCLSFSLSLCVSLSPSIYRATFLAIYLSTCLFMYLSMTVQLTASYQCVLRFFHAVSLKYCACHEKVSPGHTKCCTCHEIASWHSWWFDTPKCNPSQEISSLSSEHLCWRCLLYCACHEKCICADPLQISHACHRFWKCYKTLTF